MTSIESGRHSASFSLALALLLLFLPLPISAADKVDVTEIRYWSYPDYTRIVISLTDTTAFAQKRLSNPDRLYFDIRDSRIRKEVVKKLPIGNGMLKSVRASQFTDDTVRVVLDLEKIKDYKINSLEDPVRIMIDIYGSRRGIASESNLKKRIVIDPGHGGHDPGAVGPNGLPEKDVVLDIGLKLKKILSQDPDFEVFMTRDKDVFIPLENRTAIAISKDADLFVSVHANASPNRDARGIETYLLNWTNDEQAMRVAARENQISLKKMKKMQKETDILDVIKSDLMRENKRDESVKLANYVQQSLIDGLSKDRRRVQDLGVKQALFYVLFGAQMPSVLVEVSFISNPQEEKLLAKDDYRGELARSIAKGIIKYMSASQNTHSVAGYRKSLDLKD